MPKEKSNPAASEKKEKSTSSKKSQGHPFILGITMGLIFGIIFAWWVPAPAFFNKLKARTNEQVKKSSEKARDSMADSLENTADKIRD